MAFTEDLKIWSYWMTATMGASIRDNLHYTFVYCIISFNKELPNIIAPTHLFQLISSSFDRQFFVLSLSGIIGSNKIKYDFVNNSVIADRAC